MWIDISDEPVPTYGNHGKEFFLSLVFHDYFGYSYECKSMIVSGIWDSVNCVFFKKDTDEEIRSEDIMSWYKDI